MTPPALQHRHSLSPLFLAVVLMLSTPFLAAADIVTVTVQAPVPSDEPQWKDGPAFTSAVLNSTNAYRARYNASAVTWNATLASFAGEYLARSDCRFAHSNGPYGENLAEGYANATAGVEGWGDEASRYNFDSPGFDHDTGHFTQLVWKNTTDVGCDRRLCGQSGWYLVCEYWPRGNVLGQFGTQVDRRVATGAAAAAVGRVGAGWRTVAALQVAMWAAWYL